MMSNLESKAIQPHDAHAIIIAASVITSSRASNEKWSLYFETMWETGLRPSEVLAIRASDVAGDFKLRIRRLKKKGHPEDTMPIQLALQSLLLAYVNKYHIRPSQRLFPNTIQAATQIFHKCREAVGARPHLTLHGFRHGFAFNFLRQATHESSAETLVRLQRALDHANITTTSQYTKAGMTQVAEDIQKMRF